MNEAIPSQLPGTGPIEGPETGADIGAETGAESGPEAGAKDNMAVAVAAPAPRRRARNIAITAVLVAGCIVGWILYQRYTSGASTDDAYVRADLVQISAEVSGRVVEVAVQENQPVKAGDLLVRIDDTDYALRLKQAEANLAAAQAEASRARLSTSASRSDLKTGEVRLADASRENRLQKTLAEGGAAGQAVADKASAAEAVAAQTIETARVGIEASAAAAEGAEARLAAAQVAVDQAKRDLSLVEVRAPRSGFAAKVDPAPGELVQKGAPLLMLVPDEVYVVAAFKETDVADIRPGDAVEVKIDAFPGRSLAGHVLSIGAGTGASFSLLPADNATGNFIKVVQRVPVRIALDVKEINGQPLSVGLSAWVKILGREGT
jgi:membrane fusion protein, multidrug efflux system